MGKVKIVEQILAAGGARNRWSFECLKPKKRRGNLLGKIGEIEIGAHQEQGSAAGVDVID